MANNVIEYTLDTVPTELNYNQFYCYNNRNGKIFIGEIIGKSAMTELQIYEIGGCEYKVSYGGFSEVNKSITIGNNLKCFLEFQDFFSDYSEYIARKIKKRKEIKTKYVVNKYTFFCEITKAKTIGYNQKSFDTKEEAIEYANKGLSKMRKMLEKYSDILEELKTKLESVQTTHIKDFSFEQMMAKPQDLKEGDSLAKIGYLNFPPKAIGILVVDDNYSTFVKGFRGDCSINHAAILSDGTLLFQRECSYVRYPMLISESLKEKARERCKYSTFKGLIKQVNRDITDLKEAVPYYKNYKPFDKTKYKHGAYISKDYIDKLIDDIHDVFNYYQIN